MPAATTALDPRWYGDPAVYQRERAAVWAREWLVFAPADRLDRPGRYVADMVAGWPLFVVVAPDGNLHGFHNVCAHRGGPILWDGAGSCGNLVCRYHGWAYNWDGSLRNARDFGDIPAIDADALGLAAIRVQRWRNLVWVCLDADAPPLATALGSFPDQCAEFPMEEFRFTHEQTRTLVCNWKTYADNYLEGYHIPIVHPELNREIDVREYRVEVFEPDGYCLHTAPARDGAINRGRWLFRYPNLALNVYGHGMNVERIIPDGPDRTLVVYQFFWADPDNLANEEAVKISAVTLDQDQAICEAVQRNLDAGAYRAGPLSGRHEAGVGWFQDRIRRAVGEGD
ncbi:MAG TPA: SRPBCC family protein [Acidimicrobiia bacterium]